MDDRSAFDERLLTELRQVTLAKKPETPLSHLTLAEALATATHQHKKGGLYQWLGVATSTDELPPRGVWRHVYPFAVGLYHRDVLESLDPERFRPLAAPDPDGRTSS